MKLRAARPGDGEAIAALHLRSWRSAYRGMLPDDYIDGGLAGDLAALWQRPFASTGSPDLVLVAEESARVAGFIAIELEPEGIAHIDNLHVDPGLRGGGIGRRLIAAAARRLAEIGIGSADLWVFAANAGAVRLYDRLGGRATERATKSIFGHPVEAIRYFWTDLPALADIAETGARDR